MSDQTYYLKRSDGKPAYEIIFSFGDRLTTCVIRSGLKPVGIGVAILNPKDVSNSDIGERVAFKRAINDFYSNYYVPQCTTSLPLPLKEVSSVLRRLFREAKRCKQYNKVKVC